ncbi:MAG: phosphoglycerate dehydrogenase [Chloroflexi bacterium]|nr:phosphoglycerate dehydrogenase [Chloroflexota bacterium]MYA93766.1 phosphoglycerate dehydrogenase [Chloroflexota bacterium]MYC55640.1 phosphoglycerate dehydrogenase [Chloroflexota bacterium]MYE78177.1 phosphoglycerate dehydrogenase [Chloroflexota bacterium]MYH66024.1 phosphoglycerate dehydrogenase [Chloroflexota bacterium]
MRCACLVLPCDGSRVCCIFFSSSIGLTQLDHQFIGSRRGDYLKALSDCRVLVTPTSFGKQDPRLPELLHESVGEVIGNPLGRPLRSEELRDILPGYDGYIAGQDHIDANALSRADSLRVIARYGVGVDRVDLAAAQARGIIVTNTPGANADAVAELTIGFMLALARQIPYANQRTRRGEWPRLSGVSLAGSVVGLLGLGAIGQAVARRLRAFDCILLAQDPFVSSDQAQQLGVQLIDLDALLARADFLSLHLPATAETLGLVNVDFLASMKRGTYLINTARGELVDEAALFQALQSGHLRGAALDTFSQEPPAADNPLFRLPQVIATPHTGAHTAGAVNAMGWGALNDCLAVLRGEPPAHRVV